MNKNITQREVSVGGWAIVYKSSGKEFLAASSPRRTKRACINDYLSMWEKTSKYASWKYQRRQGVTCVRVKVTRL